MITFVIYYNFVILFNYKIIIIYNVLYNIIILHNSKKKGSAEGTDAPVEFWCVVTKLLQGYYLYHISSLTSYFSLCYTLIKRRLQLCLRQLVFIME